MKKAMQSGFASWIARITLIAVLLGLIASAWTPSWFARLAGSVRQSPWGPIVAAAASGPACTTTTLSAGGNQYLAIDASDGSVWAWGGNNNGELGNGTTTSSGTPTHVVSPGGSGILTGVATVAAGLSFSLAARQSDGVVFAWGQGNLGQLGNGGLTSSSTPVQVSGLTNVVGLAGGFAHGLAVDSQGHVWAWGYNVYGQLGNNTTTNPSTPVEVVGATGSGVLDGVVAVAAGEFQSLALKADGTVWAWGFGQDGELGNGAFANSSVPVQVSGLTGVVGIGAGSAHSLAVGSDNTAWAWGNNSFGELGTGTTTSSGVPVQVVGPNGTGVLSGVSQVAGGDGYSIAATSAGAAYGFGANDSAQLGNGTTDFNSHPIPSPVSGVGGVGSLSGVTWMTSSGGHSGTIQADKTETTWGRQAVVAPNGSSQSPQLVAGLPLLASPAACQIGSLSAGPTPAQLYGTSDGATPQVPYCGAGDAVNCATGNFTETFDEINLPGRGLPLDLALTYNSLAAAQNSPVGFGWSFSYGVQLKLGPGAATVLLGNGNSINFTLSNGSYSAPPWVMATLTQNTNGTFTYLEKRTQVSYVFSTAGFLTSEVDRNGYSTVAVDNASNQVVNVTDQAGRSLVFAYGINGNLASVTDPANRKVTLAYDASGNLSGITDVGNGVTGFTYDTSHHVLTMTDPRGGGVTNTYDSQGRVLTQVDAMTRKTTFAYGAGSTIITDPLGNQTAELFSNNEMVQVTHGFGSAQAAKWSFTYDAKTLAPTSALDPNNHLTSFTWDSSANLLAVIDADNHSTKFTYDSLSDVTSETDSLGVVTTLTYDSHGNPLSRSRPLTGTGQVQVINFLYGDSAHPGDLTGIRDPIGSTWSLAHDLYGNLVSVTDPLGNKTSFGYDTIGRRTSQVSAKGNAPGGNPSQYTTSYTYDSFGDLTAASDPLGHRSTATYDPNRNVITVTDPNGNKEQYTYDLDNEPVKVVRADGTALGNGYDAAGNLTSQVDGNGNPTKYSYDSINRLSTVTDPLGRVTSYAFDGRGNLTTITTASQLTTTYSFDPANNLTGVTYANTNTPNVTISYDADGRRSSMIDGTGKTSYAYDSLNRLTSITDGAGHAVAYTYDLDNNPTGIGYPNGKQVTQVFNSIGQITAVTDWLNNTTGFTYDPNSNMVTETYPNTTKATFTYDAANELNQIIDSKAGTTFASFVYGRDNAGQLTAMTPTGVGQGNENYTYTTISQLAGVNAGTNKYDAADNIVQFANGASLAYDAGNQLKSLTQNGVTTTYTFDARGNRTSVKPPIGASTSYTYDQANRLVQATIPGVQGVISAGGVHNLAVRSDGTVWSWGGNTFGQLGNGTTTQSNVPVQVSNLTSAISVAGGALHSIAFKTDGTVWDWGYNGSGQLGNGTTTNSSVPVQVGGMVGVTAVAAGCNFSLALKSDGTVWGWGDNTEGQLGNGTKTNASKPVQVSNLSGVMAIAGGCQHGIALKSDGTVWTWGENQNGQLGNGTTSDSSTPVRVSGLAGVTAVSGGAFHSLAARSDGSAWAWGNNQGGQLGNGTTKQSTTPVQVSNLTGVQSVAGGGAHSLAITSGGTVWAWGLNSYGQLGNGTTSSSSTPVKVTSLTNATSVSGGAAHSLAATSDAVAWDWGNNQFGQLGNGTTNNSSTPVQVTNLTSVQAKTNASYSYNGDSLRTSKTVNGTTEAFTWNLTSRIPLLIQDGGTQFIYGPQGLPVEQVNSSGTPTFLYQDQLGSTRLLSDTSGNVTGTFTYGAYGATTSHTGVASTSLQFAGQYFDAETGLYYMRARYFDPATAQFISRDPLSPSTRQPYSYAAGSPLNGVDPMGLDTALQRAARDVGNVANAIALVAQFGAIIALLVQAPAAEEGGAGLTVVGAFEAVSTAMSGIAAIADFYYYTQNPSPEALRNVVFDMLGIFTLAKGFALLRLVKGNALAERAAKLYIDTQGTLLGVIQVIAAGTAGDLTTSMQQLADDLHCLLNEATAPFGPSLPPFQGCSVSMCST